MSKKLVVSVIISLIVMAFLVGTFVHAQDDSGRIEVTVEGGEVWAYVVSPIDESSQAETTMLFDLGYDDLVEYDFYLITESETGGNVYWDSGSAYRPVISTHCDLAYEYTTDQFEIVVRNGRYLLEDNEDLGGHAEFAPAWSEDGHYLAYVYEANGEHHVSAYDGSETFLGLYSQPDLITDVVWASENELVVLSSNDLGQSIRLVRIGQGSEGVYVTQDSHIVSLGPVLDSSVYFVERSLNSMNHYGHHLVRLDLTTGDASSVFDFPSWTYAYNLVSYQGWLYYLMIDRDGNSSMWRLDQDFEPELVNDFSASEFDGWWVRGFTVQDCQSFTLEG